MFGGSLCVVSSFRRDMVRAQLGDAGGDSRGEDMKRGDDASGGGSGRPVDGYGRGQHSGNRRQLGWRCCCCQWHLQRVVLLDRLWRWDDGGQTDEEVPDRHRTCTGRYVQLQTSRLDAEHRQRPRLRGRLHGNRNQVCWILRNNGDRKFRPGLPAAGHDGYVGGKPRGWLAQPHASHLGVTMSGQR